jgi:hypothetical protein
MDMKAERAKARAKESLNAVWWCSAARMRDALACSLRLKWAARSTPLRAAIWRATERVRVSHDDDEHLYV